MTAGPFEAIVIGASAGAVQALSRLLPAFPAEYALPILIVVHIPSGRSDMAALFQAKSPLTVKEADDKEPLLASTAYFAPPDYHLLVEADRTVSLSVDDPELYSRPSINILFESAAEAYGPGLIGVILTGANEDGASGLRAVAARGGLALVEDPAEAFAPAMPAAALASCGDAQPMSLEGLATYLVKLGTR